MAHTLNVNNFLLADSIPVTDYPFAISGWFRIHQTGASTALIGLINDTQETKFECVYAGNSDQKFVANAFVSSSAAARSAIPLVVGQWHYLTANFVSQTLREVYVDGGNRGFNTNVRVFVPGEYFYIGNKTNAALVDVAELAIVKTAISESDVVALAQGVPLLASPLAKEVVAYYDFLRDLNRPGWGSAVTSTGAAAVIDHPRVWKAVASRTAVMSVFIYGPWRVEQAVVRGSYAESSQLFVSGIDQTNSVLAGEVIC